MSPLIRIFIKNYEPVNEKRSGDGSGHEAARVVV